MTGRLRVLLVLTFGLVFAGGCFTVSNVHSQKVREPGRLELGGGVLVVPGGAIPVVQGRLGLVPRLDLGARFDTFSTTLDFRLQYLTQAEQKVDASFEAGVGTAILSWFWYLGTGVSRDLGKWTPYLHARYLHALVDLAEMATEDEEFIHELYVVLTDDLVNVTQIFLGVELEMGDHWVLIPEVCWIPALDNYVSFNTALGFRF